MSNNQTDIATAALIKSLRDLAHQMPDGGAADPMIEVLGGLADQAAEAIALLLAQRDDTREIVRNTL